MLVCFKKIADYEEFPTTKFRFVMTDNEAAVECDLVKPWPLTACVACWGCRCTQYKHQTVKQKPPSNKSLIL